MKLLTDSTLGILNSRCQKHHKFSSARCPKHQGVFLCDKIRLPVVLNSVSPLFATSNKSDSTILPPLPSSRLLGVKSTTPKSPVLQTPQGHDSVGPKTLCTWRHNSPLSQFKYDEKTRANKFRETIV